jgi:hypothetical protein
MNLIFHHLCKDIRALRWLLLLWFLALFALVLPDVLIFQPDYDAARFIDKFRMSPAAIFIGFIVWTIVLARLVQSEPVTGSTSFWLTRPIPKSVFLASQLIFLGLFIFLPAFLPTLFHALIFQSDASTLQSGLVAMLIVQLLMALITIWLATYSPTLVHFAGMFCFVGVFYALTMIISVQLRVGSEGDSIFLRVIIPGFLLSLVVQHGQRRSRLGFFIGVAALVLGLLLQCFMPAARVYTVSYPALTGKWSRVEFKPGWSSDVTWTTGNENGVLYQQAVAHLLPIGLDSDSQIVAHGVNASFQPSNESGVNLMGSVLLFGTKNLSRMESLQTKLPGIVLEIGPDIQQTEPPTSLFKLSADQESKLGGKTGTLILQISGQVRTLRQLAAIPLDDQHYIGRIPGGFLRVAPLEGDTTGLLTLWALTPRKNFSMGMANELVCVLVDPRAHTGKVLSSSGNSFTSDGIMQLEDAQLYYRFSAADRKPGMVLYVFAFAATSDFRTALTAPSFKMEPPHR